MERTGRDGTRQFIDRDRRGTVKDRNSSLLENRRFRSPRGRRQRDQDVRYAMSATTMGADATSLTGLIMIVVPRQNTLRAHRYIQPG